MSSRRNPAQESLWCKMDVRSPTLPQLVFPSTVAVWSSVWTVARVCTARPLSRPSPLNPGQTDTIRVFPRGWLQDKGVVLSGIKVESESILDLFLFFFALDCKWIWGELSLLKHISCRRDFRRPEVSEQEEECIWWRGALLPLLGTHTWRGL